MVIILRLLIRFMMMPCVVVVEDNELNMKLFQDLLSLLKCKVVSTKSGSNAIKLSKEHNPDIILMDIQLDGISGIDLIQEIKQIPELCNTPIIAISAYAMKHEEVKIRQSGCDSYLSKPLSIEDFFSTIKYHLTKVKV